MVSGPAFVVVCAFTLPPLVYIILWLLLRIYSWRLRSANHARRTAILKHLGHSLEEKKRLVGFFHPYCNAGGGGERVLWTAIAAMQRTDPDIVSVVYSGDNDAKKEQIIEKVKARFDIALDPTLLHFVFLHTRYVVEDSTWPHFTLLGQSVGSMYVAWEAMAKLIPDLYIDTMGYAMTYHVVSVLGRIPVGAYVHYPTISTDMLARIKSRKEWHTNTGTISSSAILSQGKLLYYRIFMYFYALSLRTASFLMVNSSWTKNHVDAILQRSDPILDLIHLLPPLSFITLFKGDNAPESARIVYPPCDTREIAAFPLEGRRRVILSVAQFRPEKDHAAQLHAFKLLLREHPDYKTDTENGVKLVLVGGSRNSGDEARVESLRKLAVELGIQQQVEFVVNAPYPTVLKWLSTASIGLSTMVDEHFGINVVEFMAAGVIPIAHASGGPLTDIIIPFNGKRTGYHAKTPEEFAGAMQIVLTLSREEELALRVRTRTWAVGRFSEEEFEKGWNASGWRTWLPR